MSKYFKVRYGYAPLDFVSIQDDELEKAIYAQKFGEVVQIGGKQINGKHIIVIEPDYHKYAGWYPTYQPNTGADFEQIERDCPKGIENYIKAVREKIDFLVTTGRKHLIGKNAVIPDFTPKQLQ